MSSRPLNLVVRGHVRSSFRDGRLRGLVDKISEVFDVGLYCQTWNVFQNNLSWRRLDENREEMTEDIVNKYFEGLKIKGVKILDDSAIKHHGNTEGVIGRTPCPVMAWKNMYYGKFVASRCVVEKEPAESVTMQMRFDILSNPFSPREEEILDFVRSDYALFEESSLGDERMRFLRMRCFLGVDNLYMATAHDMHKFISYMYYDMDRILHFHRRTIHQEHIAFHERKSFDGWQMPGDPVGGPAAA
jgi:hypothetical protein